MRWLHISDLHYDPSNANSGTLMMSDALINCLQSRNISVDAIFVTGDFRFARTQDDTDDNAKLAADMLLQIAKTANVNRNDGSVDVDRIFIVPGNHDLNRDYPNRVDLLEPIKSKYIKNFYEGTFQKNNLKLLYDSFVFYHRVLKQLYGEDGANFRMDKMFITSPHTHEYFRDTSILLLNTALLSQDSDKIDPHTLLCGHKYITSELSDIRSKHPNEPIIVLAHHSMDQLNEKESMEIKKIFNTYNVELYLCGHSHALWHEKINEIHHITMGCIRNEANEQAGFSFGEYDPDSRTITIQAYEWRQDFPSPKWTLYSGFSDGESSDLVINLRKAASPYKPSSKGAERKPKCIDTETQKQLDSYKSSLMAQYAKVKLLQFSDGLEEEDIVDVDSIYVDLYCEPFSKVPASRSGENMQKGSACSEVLVSSLANLVILGLPGAGKTTLLRYLLKKLSEKNATLIPVYMELKSEVNGELAEILRKGASVNREDINRYVKSYLSNWGASETLFDYVKGNSSLFEIVFFCDGLDEISHEQYTMFTNAANKASSFIGLRFIISSRQIGFLSSDYSEKFKLYCLLDFDIGKQQRFISKFFTAGSKERQDKLKQHTLQQRELTSLLSSNQTISRLAKSPILLSLLCVTPNLKTIKNKAQLFKRAIEVLLRNRKITSEDDQKLFISFLKELAVVFFKLDKAECFEEIELKFYAERFFCRQDASTCSRLGEKYLDCGLFDKSEKTDAYKFAHRTIWEYLVAEGMLDRDKNEVYNRANMGVWEEPIKMFVSLVEQSNPEYVQSTAVVIRELWKKNKALALSCMNEFETFPRDMFENLYGSLSKRDKLRLIATLKESYVNNPSDFRLPVINTIRETLSLMHTVEKDCEVVYAYLEFLEEYHDERAFSEILGKFLDLSNLENRRKMMDKLGLEFVEVKSGTFCMGRNATNRSKLEADERKKFVTIDSEETPEHRVRISRPFFIAKTPVTNEMYYNCGFPYADFDHKSNPYSDEPNQPVNFVNWYEAMVFAKWLGYTLPSEAEWEYACRIGGPEYMTEDMSELTRLLDKTARYAPDGANKTRAVIPIIPQYANNLGVVDMLGNLREWCLDWYNDDFYMRCDVASYSTFQADIKGKTSVCYYWDGTGGEEKSYLVEREIPADKDIFVFDNQGNCVDPIKTIVGKFESKSLRGGCFDWSVSNLRPTYRNHNPASNIYKVNGFRLIYKEDNSYE